MSDEQLWTDERIGNNVIAVMSIGTYEDICLRVEALCLRIRDEYEANHAALQAQVASLEGTLTEVREIIKYVDDYAYAWDDLEQLLFGEIDEEVEDATH